MTFSYLQEDDWWLEDKDPQSQHYGKKFHFNFSELNGDEIKDVVKSYVWSNYVTQNMTISGIYKCFVYFKWFNRYAIKSHIITLKNLTNMQICLFMSHLNTVVSEKTDKKLAHITRKTSLDSIKSIIHWCQIHKPEAVPSSEIFTGNEYTGVNQKLRIDFIPDEVLLQINTALKTEENPYLKYGIIILESTGMRIGDLLNLKKDCIKPHLISGYTISWFDHKNRKYHKPMPVRFECVEAVQQLTEATEVLRLGCDEQLKNLLFIHKATTSKRSGQIIQIQNKTFELWYKSFVKRHNIIDSDGNLYHLTNHQFRRTLGTDMLSKGVNINVIQEVLGHSDPSTTKRFYADVKDKDRAEIFSNIGIIGNINQLDKSHFNNEIERVWFSENKDTKAALCDGYCTKPIVNGEICDRLLKRQKCYTCSRYITTPEYLEYHKQHLAELEFQVEQGEIYGEHYKEHFLPTIETLKIIIERLEELKNGC